MAPGTYIRRSIGKTLPLMLVIVLAVMLIAGIIALIDSIPLSIRTIYGYTKFSAGFSPRGDVSVLPSVIQKIKTEAPVPLERLMKFRASQAQVASIVGKWPFAVLGFDQDDMAYYLKRMGMTGLTGRLPADGAAEAVVSDPVAVNLKLKIGSVLLSPDEENSFSPVPVTVVGIAHTSEWLMLDSKSFQDRWFPPPIDLVMACAKTPADQATFDQWARSTFKGSRVEVFTYAEVQKQTNHMFAILFQLLNLVIAMLVLVITLMMGLLINIYQSQRLVEFGLLQAIGYTKRRLILRSLAENVLIVALGWVLGLFMAFWLLTVLRHLLMAPHAFALDVFDPTAYLYTVPVPVTILITACGSVFWRFRRFDPVAVVERRIV